MTLITDALDRIAREVSVDTPASWITATDLEHVEIRDDFLLETVDEVLERLDLPSPIGAQTTISGDGSETYSLPSDFKRLQRDQMAVFETTTVRRACIPVSDDGVWSYLKEIGSTGAERYYKIDGYDGNWTISFYKEPPSGISVIVSYVTTSWKANASGTAGSTFTATDDVLLLPRRVVEAGTVMRWRERRGVDASAKRVEFEAEMAKLSNDRRVRRVIHMGEGSMMRNPWDIPVPDEIPTS